MPALEILAFALALWLGLYLIGRDPANPRLRFAGLGLVAYALGLAGVILGGAGPLPPFAGIVERLRWPLLFLPALVWTGAVVQLLPEGMPWRVGLARLWRGSAGPVAILVLVLGAGTDLVFDPATGNTRFGPALIALAVTTLLPLLAAALLLWRSLEGPRSRGATGAILVALLFFALSTGLLLVPLGPLPRGPVLVLLGLDLIMLGAAIAALDALDAGETLLPDLARSFDASFIAATIFGGQVGLVIALGTGLTVAMLALLLGTIAAAITTQIFADRIGGLIDRLALARFPRLQRARSELRAAASALPRAAERPDLAALDEAEFARLTRRALSHFGDLPRLAASPLTSLPLIDARLAGRGAGDDALERAAELKDLLTESVARLKPRAGGDFGTSDEWRHYNALYFPYVAGLKPYSQRTTRTGLDPAARQALDWFRTDVPERTLYNWQTAAAKLVARDLRARAIGQHPAAGGHRPPAVGRGSRIESR